MASKIEKEKVKKPAIGDQILLDVARFDLKMGVAASLAEFRQQHEIKIGALVTYGFLKRDGSYYRLTETGITYLKRSFPDGDFERSKLVKHAN